MPDRIHDALALGRPHAGRSAPVARGRAPAHFHEHHRPVGRLHDEIDLAAATPRRPIIACQQPQPGGLQMAQGPLFGLQAGCTGAERAGRCRFVKALHLNANFALALTAAHAAAAPQHYPQGTLYVLATPIGNLADITLRALHVLQLVDALACEDTRHTQALLRAYGLARDGLSLLAVHQHNEAEAAQQVIARLRRGERVACVSDAGTPAVSDPGGRLVAAVHAAGLPVSPVPGASSVTAALSVAGAAAADAPGFVFAGFLPTRSGERSAAVQALAQETRAVVLLEAPHRILELADSLAPLGQRTVTVARELTKQFEQVHNLPAAELPQWLRADAARCRGEFVLVLHPCAREETPHAAGLRALRLLLAELPLKRAVQLAAELSGAPRNALYEAALQLKKEDDR